MKLRADIRVLTDALDHLDWMVSGENVGPGVQASPMQCSYLESWVLDAMRDVLADMEGTKPLPGWRARP